jgi:hypothetical protein
MAVFSGLCKPRVMESTNLFILFGIRQIFDSNGRNLLLYLFAKQAITLNIVIIEEYIQQNSLKNNSAGRRNYWG